MRNISKLLTTALTVGLFAGLALGQESEKKVVVHPDGSYTVIEYPLNKEVVVNLLPMAGVTGSTAKARVARTADGTKIYFDVAGAPADWKSIYAYAVDPTGKPTLLGPIEFASGAGKAEFMTPMNQFMLVVSPAENLTTYDTATTYVYRSEIPQGYAIVPRAQTAETKAVASAKSVTSTYDVPMLGVPKLNGRTTEVRVNFGGELKGLDGKAYLKPEGGKTSIKMRFGDLKKAPANKRLVLWTSNPDGTFTKIGQVVNGGVRDESEIRGDTAQTDFGLLVTVEDTDVDRPTSTIYSPFKITP